MKIPVDIHVRSERFTTDLAYPHIKQKEPDVDDFCVSGMMRNTKGGYRIEYSEEEGAVTTIISAFKDGMVVVNRIGFINSHMVFAHGKSHTCICNTGFMPMQLRVKTKELKNNLTMDGGKLDIDFAVEIMGNLAETNRLTFSVSPDISIIKS